MKIDYRKIAKTHWYRQEITSVMYFALGPSWGCLESLKGGQETYWYIKEHNTRNYLSGEYFLKLAKKYFEKYRKDRQSLRRIYRKWLDWNQGFEKLINKVRKPEVNQLTDSQLLLFNKQVGLKAHKFWTLEFFMDIYDLNTETLVETELNDSKIKIKPEEMNILVQPDKLYASQAYCLDILKLHFLLKKPLPFKQLTKQIQGKIKQTIAKHYYINNSFAQVKPLTYEIILKDLKQLKGTNHSLRKELNRLEHYQTYVTGQKQRIYNKYGFSEWLKDVFIFFSIIGLWRDQRKAMLQKTVTALDKLGREIAKRSQLPWSEVSCLVPYAINRIPVPKLLFQRFRRIADNHYLNVWDNHKKKVVFLSKKTCDKLMEYFEPAKGQFKELTGQVACPGQARGVAKVIMGEKDFHKFKPDDILVTVNTRPEFVPLMKKAKAIITDEGGITSHAAIVSRELNKPCVIGTQIATRVLKSGDRVEVDAYKGLVKILK